MATSDPLAILLAHDRWATTQMLEACEKLSDEQFHKRFEMGPGSLHDTLTHMLAAMRAWGDMLAGREMRPRLEGTQRTVAELKGLLAEIASDFAASARSHPLEGTITRERGGKTYTFTRGAVLTQVTTHGTHHRAQCLNMLRRIIAKDLAWKFMARSFAAGRIGEMRLWSLRMTATENFNRAVWNLGFNTNDK